MKLQAARTPLQRELTKGGNTADVQQALDTAAAVGLQDAVMETARNFIETSKALHAKLVSAMKQDDAGALAAALEEAANIDLNDTHVQVARDRLTSLQECVQSKHAARPDDASSHAWAPKSVWQSCEVLHCREMCRSHWKR